MLAAAEVSGFSFMQLMMITRLQARAIRLRKEGRQVLKKNDTFQDEKPNGGGSRPKKLTFQEQILTQRVTTNAGGKHKRPQTPEATNQVSKSTNKGGSTTKDFDWYRQADDADAEKMIRRLVPSTVRYLAVALAHQRVSASEEGAKLWEKMRWTKRLRLCEEIHGASF